MSSVLLADAQPVHVPVVDPDRDQEGRQWILPFVMTKAQFKAYRDRLWHRDPTCAYCGHRVKLSNATLDHILPRSKGGLDTPSNLVLACERCNQTKASRSATEWRDDLISACDRIGGAI